MRDDGDAIDFQRMTEPKRTVSPLLVGRDDLLDLVDRRLDEVVGGRGQFLLITGEPDAASVRRHVLPPDDLAELFTQAGIPFSFSANIRCDMWQKMVVNCVYNAISAIARVRYGRIHDNPHSLALVRPLVEQRAVAGIEPVQFALAGMNAHINPDLPMTMVSTCAALATAPDAGEHSLTTRK